MPPRLTAPDLSPFAYAPPNAASVFTGFVIVRLRPKYADLPGETLLAGALTPTPAALAPCGAGGVRSVIPPMVFGPALPELAAYLQQHNLQASTRLIISVLPSVVQQMELDASVSALAPLRSLRQYWRVDARAGYPTLSDITSLASDLAQLPGIESAVVERRLDLPLVDPSDDDLAGEQFYLDPPSLGGIDAKAMWAAGIDGNGAGFVDIEGGWFLHHIDLPTFITTLPDDLPNQSQMAHGTNVLGIVLAGDNDRGVVGIAPGTSRAVVSSVYRTDTGQFQPFLADSILKAIGASQVGDVMLVEWETSSPEGGLPVEVDDHNFDAIRLACALGRVVIEPAGNGKNNVGVDLDGIVRDGVNVLQRGVRDSGAVLVAASDTAFYPRGDTNYGTRVDCFAPGQKLTTTDYESALPDPNSYRYDFAKTSGASAVVAGAAVLVQAANIAKLRGPLSPSLLRSTISDPAINTPQGTSAHRIGWMPDLGRIAMTDFPDVYVRDSLADDGRIPTTGILSASPDIIVRQVPVASPELEFGEASGTMGLMDLSDPVVAGAAHSIYVRVTNRGGADAIGTTAKVYWAQPATLIAPDNWNLIGTTAAFDVAAGAVTVGGPLAWPAAAIPNAGHYCFVAVVTHPEDDVVIPNNLAWNEFHALVANNNNVAWRNFEVIDAAAAADAGGWLRLPFIVRGGPGRPRPFQLEIEWRSLDAAAIWLETPIALNEQIRERLIMPPSPDAVDEYRRDHRTRGVLVDLARAGGLRRRSIHLGGGASHDCAIIIRLPFAREGRSRTLTVRQFHKNVCVGALTWSFPKNAD